MRVAQVNDSAHLNSMRNLIPHRPTNRPHTLGGYPVLPIAGGRAGGLGGKVDWSTAPVNDHFDEVHNQLMHLHSYQIADLFNRQNITDRYVAFQIERLSS